jgi:hypothetical protein
MHRPRSSLAWLRTYVAALSPPRTARRPLRSSPSSINWKLFPLHSFHWAPGEREVNCMGRFRWNIQYVFSVQQPVVCTVQVTNHSRSVFKTTESKVIILYARRKRVSFLPILSRPFFPIYYPTIKWMSDLQCEYQHIADDLVTFQEVWHVHLRNTIPLF